LSKEIAQTLGGKRIAWLIAIVSAFVVFATIGSSWSAASAAELNAVNNSQTAVASNASVSVNPSMNLPDIRGSTIEAVHFVVNSVVITTDTIASVIVNSSTANPGFWVFVAVTVGFIVLLKIVTIYPLMQFSEPRYIRRQNLGMYDNANTSGISKRSGLKRASLSASVNLASTRNLDTTTTLRMISINTISRILRNVRVALSCIAGPGARTSKLYYRTVISIAGRMTHLVRSGVVGHGMKSSFQHIGGWVSYPIIAPTTFVHFAISRRNIDLATSGTFGETSLLHTSFEHNRPRHSDGLISNLWQRERPINDRPAFALLL